MKKVHVISLGMLLGAITSCSGAKPVSTVAPTDSVNRETASGQMVCEGFENYRAEEKLKTFYNLHLSSMQDAIDVEKNSVLKFPNLLKGEEISSIDENNRYLDIFFGGVYRQTTYAAAALAATAKFLVPESVVIAARAARLISPIGNLLIPKKELGYKTLKPTFDLPCELFQAEEVKKVHALGTMAKARMNVYSKLKVLDSTDKVIGEASNPWTGLLAPIGNETGVPLLLRFSIANPVAHTVEVGNKSLLLEFIPGLGIKFLVDGSRSIDLVAMESLAGQGNDHNYFKYEFSPDFSAHAPSEFMASSGAEQAEMIKRYDRNIINHFVMNQVGKRFNDVVPHVMKIAPGDLKPHSNEGVHPFAISIAKLAEQDVKGEAIKKEDQRRPWRLVFKPALDNLPKKRYKEVTSTTPYIPNVIKTDFRHKLSSLQPKDRLYYVIGETKEKKRYILGEVVLESFASPSLFADRLFFVQHRLDEGRLPANAYTISAP